MKLKRFTLLELLIIIAIIGLLVTLLVPSLVKARQEATKAVCLSNLKQIAIFYTYYTNDNNGFYPSHSYGPPIGRRGTLFDQYGDTLGISKCPGDNGAPKVGKKAKEKTAWQGTNKSNYKCAAKRTRFGIDWIIAPDQDSKKAKKPRTLEDFKRTDNKLFMGDIYEANFDWTRMQWHGGKKRRSCNILFIDSHASFLRFPTEYNTWSLGKKPDIDYLFY